MAPMTASGKRIGRLGLLALLAGLVGAAACGEDVEGGGSAAGTATGTGSGTATGTSSGTATGTGSGTATGTGTGTGGDPCEPTSALSPEERFRLTCAMTVSHPDWGQCAADPTVADALDACANSDICADCPYLWYVDATYGSYVNCLAETAALRCCLLAQPSSGLACNTNDESAFLNADSVTACSSVYDIFHACMF